MVRQYVNVFVMYLLSSPSMIFLSLELLLRCSIPRRMRFRALRDRSLLMLLTLLIDHGDHAGAVKFHGKRMGCVSHGVILRRVLRRAIAPCRLLDVASAQPNGVWRVGIVVARLERLSCRKLCVTRDRRNRRRHAYGIPIDFCRPRP